MSSGNRLLRDVLEAGRLRADVDTSHGTRPLPAPDFIVVIVRDEDAARASWRYHWAGKPESIDFDLSLRQIARRYPQAPRVSYEQLCARPTKVIRQLAALTRVRPWRPPMTFENCNDKWLLR